MVKEAYRYVVSENKEVYVFQSEGQNGKIIKIVVFSPEKFYDSFQLNRKLKK